MNTKAIIEEYTQKAQRLLYQQTILFSKEKIEELLKTSISKKATDEELIKLFETEFENIRKIQDSKFTFNSQKQLRIIEGEEYRLPNIIASEKDFPGKSIEIDDNEFLKRILSLTGKTKPPTYITGSEILNSGKSIPANHLNRIFDITFNSGMFHFLDAMKIVKFENYKIHHSELTGARDSYGKWIKDKLGHYGYIRLKAIDSDGGPMCLEFNDSGSLFVAGSAPGRALRVVNKIG